MVKYNIIFKIIEDVINNKCSNNSVPSNNRSWGVRLNQRVRKAFDDFREKYCKDMENNSKIEHTMAVDKDGNIVYENSGEEDKVFVDMDYCSIKRDLSGSQLFITHNHPHGFHGIPVMFSDADVEFLLKKATDVMTEDYVFKGINVQTANGSSMNLIKKSNFGEENHSDFLKTYNKMLDIYYAYVKDFKKTRGEKQIELHRCFRIGECDNLIGLSDVELENHISDRVIGDIGSFESRLGGVRREFNDCNVELSIEWE